MQWIAQRIQTADMSRNQLQLVMQNPSRTLECGFVYKFTIPHSIQYIVYLNAIQALWLMSDVIFSFPILSLSLSLVILVLHVFFLYDAHRASSPTSDGSPKAP